ncbi:MAG: hypothetical protein ACYTAN_02005 [Planctomycetota bacterium]|jgi:hypothetical protein
MIERLVSTLLALTVCLVPLSTARSDEDPPEASPRERYKVIVERNIFLPERPRATARPAVAVPEYRPEGDLVLTGVIQEGEQHVAFLEHVHTRVTSRVRAGDAVARGRISEIALDHVEYEMGEHTGRVELGQRLDSALPADPSAGTPETPTAEDTEGEGDAEAPAIPSSDRSDKAVLERMLQRRQKELRE